MDKLFFALNAYSLNKKEVSGAHDAVFYVEAPLHHAKMAASESSSIDDRGGVTLPMLQKVGVDAWLRAHGKTVRPELTKKQKQELKECFDLIDADGSGAIDAEELVTAFNVLGMRVKKSEVEKMLAEVDADGSGEVEYPEFVQIMTSKLDSQVQEGDSEEKSSKQPLPFQLLAQAYRRKKRMKRAEARRKLGKGETLPDYIVEHLGDELKHIILESCDIQKDGLREYNGTPAIYQSKASIIYPKDMIKFPIGGRTSQEASPMSFYKQELAELGHYRTRVRHKPVLERQLLHLRAVKSIQEYLQNQASSA